jgi:hypothetical protein
MMGLQTLKLDDKAVNLLQRGQTIGKEMKAEGKTPEDIKAATTALRARAGLPGTPLNLQTNDNIVKALQVRNNEVANPLDIFSNKANGPRKTRDFTETLATGGDHSHATIDTHAYDAALNNYHIEYGIGNKHLKKAGVYNFMQNAYATAHAHALKKNLIPSDTTIADYQAMHWVHHINNKVKVNPRAAATAESSVTQTTNLLNRYPDLDPVTHGLKPIITRNQHFDTGSVEGR